MADIGRETTEAYAAALVTLCHEWMHGQIDGIPPPPNNEGMVCLNYLENYSTTCETQALEIAYKELKQFHVVRHFDQAASHRRWLTLWRQLLNIADIDVDVTLQRVIEVHDLSKYSPEEALGYGIMFGETGKFRRLEGRQKELWDLALVNHYQKNPHHPQYYVGQTMDNVHLQESVLDMLACRTERTLFSVKSVTPSTLVDIPDNFLDRYVPGDRSMVKVILSQWLRKLELVIEDMDSVEVVNQWEDETGKKLVLEDRCDSDVKTDTNVITRTVPSSSSSVSSCTSHAGCCDHYVDGVNKKDS